MTISFRVNHPIFIALLSFSASAAELETGSFIINIESRCAEGEVSCNQMTYHGTSKATGNSIMLEGSSWHTLCADGDTPCRFLGYKFENGNTTYYVHQDGLLEVIRNRDEVLVRERGSWRKE
ncbi:MULTISPECIES: hypothetical protein [Marinobacter]|jgi:hypothetical protein|uniref:hypothetical protein n=1 Tax=Marinobacter sp. W-8 TaxID=3369658 RepID=UPI0037C54F3B